MTKITFYVKMFHKEHFNTENNAEKIRLEICTEDILSLWRELKETCEKEEKKMAKEYEVQKEMEEMHVDLESAVNYLVQLFYLTGKRYSCTRTKIGKLLSIVAFVYARQGKEIFKETIHKYDDCGTAIYEIMERFKDSEIYTRCAYEDAKRIISDDIMTCSSSVDMPADYENYSELNEDVRHTIDLVFKHFGSFSPGDLGECINPIVDFYNVTNEVGEVNLLTLKELDYSSLKSDENSLISFLKNIR